MKELYKELFKKYGDKQLIVAIEELSELQKEICKALRGKLNIDNITEEIADVEIMIDQLKFYLSISNETVEEMKKYKIERTKERVLKEVLE